MIRIVFKDGKTCDVESPDLFHWAKAETFFGKGVTWEDLRSQLRGNAYVLFLRHKKIQPSSKPFWDWLENVDDYIQLDEDGNPLQLLNTESKTVPLG